MNVPFFNKAANPPKELPKDLAGKISDTVAAAFALAIGITLWAVGAFLTLTALAAFGIPVSRFGLAAWLIPIGVSAVEVRFWPRPENLLSYRSLMLPVIALPDLASTFFGAWTWLK